MVKIYGELIILFERMWESLDDLLGFIICLKEWKKKEQIQIYISPHKTKEIFLEKQISKYFFAFLQTE